MNAKEIAEKIANQWYEGGTDEEEKELCVNALARIIERALIAYGAARLEQAAKVFENGLGGGSWVANTIRALKETK